MQNPDPAVQSVAEFGLYHNVHPVVGFESLLLEQINKTQNIRTTKQVGKHFLPKILNGNCTVIRGIFLYCVCVRFNEKEQK